ncbi:integrase, catalytic region, zinc finger, CCHC-type containing protein [Tanacetum coccineum]
MTTLAEFMIVAGVENRPPMLDKAMYTSWESLDGQIRKNKYTELTEQEQLQDDCDVQAMNIVLQGLIPDVYALVNHCQSAKDIWERVNTKFLNALQTEWRKFVTDVKLAKNMHTTNYDQLYAYLSQHEGHANEVRMMRERYPDPLALVAHYLTQSNSAHQPIPSVPQNAYHSPLISQQPPVEFPQINSGLAVLVFLLGDDPIACLNKAMAFMSTVVASCFPSTNNQLYTSSNPQNQATIQDGRVTVQQVQGRHGQSSSLGTIGNATTSRGNNAAGQARAVKCYNCQGEGHMARQCTQPKRPRNEALFKEKLMLVEAQESGQVLDEEQLAFLADPGITDCHDVQPTIIHNAAFQTDDLDAYDSDCDDISSAKAVLMANLSSYDSDVLSETQNVIVQDTNSSTQQDSMIMHVFEQLSEKMSNHVTNWDKVNQETKTVNESLTADFERYKEHVKTLEQRFNVDLNSHEKLIDSQIDYMIQNRCALKQEINSLKHTLSNQVKENESLLQTFNVFKKESKEKENFENGLHNELNEVKTVFNQMEAAVKQCSIDQKYFDIQKKEVSLDDD